MPTFRDLWEEGRKLTPKEAWDQVAEYRWEEARAMVAEHNMDDYANCPHPDCVTERENPGLAAWERDLLAADAQNLQREVTKIERVDPPRYEIATGKFTNAADDYAALTALTLEGVPLHKYRWSPLSDDTQYVLERIEDDNGS